MIEKIAEFFSGNIMIIVTSVIALIGFAFSVYNFVSTRLANHKKLTIFFGITELKDYTIDVFNKKPFHVYFRFENGSQLPISITRIRILANDKWFGCEASDYIIEQTSYIVGKEIVQNKCIWNTILPINRSCLASASGYLVFLIPPNTLSNSDVNLTFEISTNRGKAVRKRLSLYEAVRF